LLGGSPEDIPKLTEGDKDTKSETLTWEGIELWDSFEDK
jgi:hypothetical protein